MEDGTNTIKNNIIIDNPNFTRITFKEVEELVQSLRSAFPEYNVQLAEHNESVGKGFTLFEVLRIYVSSKATEIVIDNIMKISINWARKRFAKPHHEHSQKYIALYGPDGEVLKTIVLKNATDEPEDRTEADSKLGNMPVPKAEEPARKVFSFSDLLHGILPKRKK